ADHAGDLPNMERAARSALMIAMDAHMRSETIKAMSELGAALCGLQRHIEGLPLLYRSMARARTHRNGELVAQSLLRIARSHWMRGNYLQALKYQRRS